MNFRWFTRSGNLNKLRPATCIGVSGASRYRNPVSRRLILSTLEFYRDAGEKKSNTV